MGSDNPIKTGVPALVFYGHPALRKASVDITEITDDIRELALDMVDTMYDHEGIGLAAPQMGVNINMIVIDVAPPDPESEQARFLSPGEVSLFPKMPVIMVNPRIGQPSAEEVTAVEGCLSIPGVSAEVPRPATITVAGQTLSGKAFSYPCGGLLGRCIQHECDHLNGVLFIDYLDDDALDSIGEALDELKAEQGETS